MKKKFKLENTGLIYNFIDIQKEHKNFNFNVEEIDIVNFSNDFNFISIWRLDRLKWFLPMIRVFNSLVDKYEWINLIILWEWKNRDFLENYIKKNNLNQNIFLLWSKKMYIHIY